LRHALRRDFAAAKIEPDRRGNGDRHEAENVVPANQLGNRLR
jgi:hypothetical protein